MGSREPRGGIRATRQRGARARGHSAIEACRGARGWQEILLPAARDGPRAGVQAREPGHHQQHARPRRARRRRRFRRETQAALAGQMRHAMIARSRWPSVAALGAIVLSTAAIGGGSNYGIAPGTHAMLAGKVSEWPVPTPRFARDPAPAPDGSIYISVMSGNKVARFDPKTQTFKEWDMPPGHRPHGLLVDKQGVVWTTGNGNGTIGRLEPASGKITEFQTPSRGEIGRASCRERV